MCEDHLYWAGLHARWMVEANFDKGPRRFFDTAPAPLRPLVVAMVRRQVRRNLWGHGMGRHTTAEMDALATRDIDALADVLGDKPYLMGDRPCGADAAIFPDDGARAVPALRYGHPHARRAAPQPRRLQRPPDGAVFSGVCGENGGSGLRRSSEPPWGRGAAVIHAAHQEVDSLLPPVNVRNAVPTTVHA